jgi:hypothetical protein
VLLVPPSCLPISVLAGEVCECVCSLAEVLVIVKERVRLTMYV